MTVLGVDYSFSRPAPDELKANGIAFACRYLSSDGSATHKNTKDLTASEATSLHTAGLTIVLNYESTATFMLGGYSAGQQVAKWARAQASSVGAPAGTPIYYSADFDANATQVEAAVQFLEGAAASEGGKGLVGIYGGHAVVKAAGDAGFHYLWQTFAWSGGVWDARAVLRQTAVERTLAGASVDLDEALAGDYGQWAPVAPHPKPTPAPALPGSVSEGGSGPAVERLQRTLTMGNEHPGAVDGHFGPATKAAVLAWQRAHAAQTGAADGVVGPKTWGSLVGWVERVQTALSAAGFSPGPLDGDPGPATLSAVERFQRAKHLLVDGVVGPRTSAALHV